MSHYVLYLDESETFTPNGNRYFAVAGVIVEKNSLVSVTADLDTLKSRLWTGDPAATSHILHEKEISEAHKTGRARNTCYNIFRANQKVLDLYAGLSNIIKKHSIATLGVCLDKTALVSNYPGETNAQLTIALQMLLENYCHYLQHVQGKGDICYESLQEPGNQPLRQRFYELEALGTMYYTPHFFQTHIGDICFEDKSNNLPGLQLADFIPNTYARKCAGIPAKHAAFQQCVMRQAYDGGMGNRPKFGLKKIP